MDKSLDQQHLSASLRRLAEQKLSNGSAQLKTSFVASQDALGVLYRLSSSAITASDGLKLLHELQVHQVELELQLEQLQCNERQFDHEFTCYQQFFAMNPVACLTISTDGTITNGNAAATRLFTDPTEAQPEHPLPQHLQELSQNLSQQNCQQLVGRSMLSLLNANCRPLYSAALARVQRNHQRATLLVEKATTSACSQSVTGANSMRLTINMSPDYNAILIMLT
ncbi:hypothetical protein [Arsukibacterium sp.]|uniref:hypothetical protein n=1 Tax=Arsukibacterium sp. TaxID=1977258 RepID=UPI00356A0E89